jgi:hypothetical protein
MRVRISTTLVLAALCASFAAPVLATPPAAPVVTVGAGIKTLQFDWESVPRSNYYELWFKANDGASWIKYSETPAQSPRIRITASVHLLDWRVAKYRVAACNFSGCTNSSELTVTGLATDAVGYFKPPNPGISRGYGMGTAVSADGKAFAVMSGDVIGGVEGIPAVNVYRKNGASWRRNLRVVPSRILPGTAQYFQTSYTPLSLNGDGTVLVLGIPSHTPRGSDMPQHSGAVFVFRYDGTRWNEEQMLESPFEEGYFGWHVDIDDAGELLIATRFAGYGLPYPSTQLGETLAFRHSSAGWTQVAALNVSQGSVGQRQCAQSALSGNGRWLVRACRYSVEVFRTSDWTKSAEFAVGSYSNISEYRGGAIDTNFDGNRIVVRLDDERINMFWKSVSGWRQDGEFRSGTFQRTFAAKIAMSRDGKMVAAGDTSGCHPGAGPVYPPFAYCQGQGSGQVTVFEYRGTHWQPRSYIKPNIEVFQSFGQSVALGDNGRILVVGAPLESSNASGIDGDQTDTSAPERGAVWLY